MFDARAEHEKLLDNVDRLLAKTAARTKAVKAASAKPSDKSASLAARVGDLQVEAAAKQSELKQLVAKKTAARAQKVAEARHIVRVALNLLVA